MGAGVALILKSSITELDPGEVAFQSLGFAGDHRSDHCRLDDVQPDDLSCRPCLSIAQSQLEQNPGDRDRRRRHHDHCLFSVRVFTKLLGFVGIMGLMLAPVGAVMVTEHWIFPRIGFTRYWSHYRKEHDQLRSRHHLVRFPCPRVLPGTGRFDTSVLPADTCLDLRHACVHHPGQSDGRQRRLCRIG